LTAVTWIVLTLILVVLVIEPGIVLLWVAVAIGVTFTVVGRFDAIGSCGRHVGWPLLTAIGILALISLLPLKVGSALIVVWRLDWHDYPTLLSRTAKYERWTPAEFLTVLPHIAIATWNVATVLHQSFLEIVRTFVAFNYVDGQAWP